jgi:hypothetical protein
MAPRAYWKGYLKLSLVSCPIALFPATSEREKISFHQLNKETGHCVKYRKVDAETGEEVDSEKIIKGYEVGKGSYIEIGPEELEAIAIESKRTIEIDVAATPPETPPWSRRGYWPPPPFGPRDGPYPIWVAIAPGRCGATQFPASRICRTEAR